MSEHDRRRWDERYTNQRPAPVDAVALPPVFAPYEDEFPTVGHALDLACGQGGTAVWLAGRGLNVRGVDVSPVAVEQARGLFRRSGTGGDCSFDVADLDAGLPAGPPADVIFCHKFRDPRLDQVIVERLARGGLLAITVLSEVGATPSRFRAAAGELPAAFAGLEVITAGEGGGEAWLLGRA